MPNNAPVAAPPEYREVLYTEHQITERIAAMAHDLTERYQGQSPLFVCLLRGGAPFAALLMFAIARHAPTFHPEIDYMLVRTYGDTLEAKQPQVVMDLGPKTVTDGRPVVVLDDVLDTGVTAEFVAGHLRDRGATSVDLVVLMQKRLERTAWPAATLYGFEAPGDWLTGMGLDDPRVGKEANRWLPLVALAAEKHV